MSVNVTLPRKILRFGNEEIDISNSELDQSPYPEQYRRVLYAFVRDTVAHCEFYRERMARAGIKPEQITNQEVFDAIPPLSSGEVSTLNDSTLLPDLAREHLKSGYYGAPLEQKLWRKFTTSGSSGLRPKVSYYTREDWNGERGLVVITGIRNGSRFIRYAVGDEATYVTDTCLCGRASPRLVDIQRVEDMERLQQGCAGGL